ncbi:MAG TPA: hypothetical protein VMB71_08500, partial [Acetobacteraceae bacterium]|nr:hypothetical protein [Acetobacteraceae bacterium]
MFTPPFGVGDVLSSDGLLTGLQRFGDETGLERLGRLVKDPELREIVLTTIARTRAASGDIDRALAVADEFREGDASRGDPSLRGKIRGVVAPALVAHRPDAALRLAETLPRGFYRQELMADIAGSLCSNPATARLGRNIAAGAVKEFRQFHPGGGIVKLDYYELRRIDEAVHAGTALAICEGPAAALTMIDRNFPIRQSRSVCLGIAMALTEQKKNFLARAIAPKPDPTDKDNMPSEITWLWDVGDHEAARMLATQAQKRLTNAGVGGTLFPDEIQVGAFDAAAASAMQDAPQDRACDLARVILARMKQGDAGRAARLLPLFTETFHQHPDAYCGEFIVPMFVALAHADLRNDARDAMQAFETDLATQKNCEKCDPTSIYTKAYRISLDVMFGDLKSALTVADRAGAMTVVHDCGGDHARDEITCPAYKGRAHLGTRLFAPERFPADERRFVRGPKAIVLGRVAQALAQCGRLADAWRVEALLEAEPRDALREPRDQALAAIAEAQIEADDPNAAFATATRIDDLGKKWTQLLALAAIPPH